MKNNPDGEPRLSAIVRMLLDRIERDQPLKAALLAGAHELIALWESPPSGVNEQEHSKSQQLETKSISQYLGQQVPALRTVVIDNLDGHDTRANQPTDERKNKLASTVVESRNPEIIATVTQTAVNPTDANLKELEDIKDSIRQKSHRLVNQDDAGTQSNTTLRTALETLELATELVQRALGGGRERHPQFLTWLKLAAESQQMLRTLTQPAGETSQQQRANTGQPHQRLHSVLREILDREQIYIHHHMRHNDLANIERLEELTEQIRDGLSALRHLEARDKLEQKLSYHNRLSQDKKNAGYHRLRIKETLAALQALEESQETQEAEPAHRTPVREAVCEPVTSSELNQTSQHVTARQLKRGLQKKQRTSKRTSLGGNNPAGKEIPAQEDRPASHSLTLARGLLSGKSILIIGGDQREQTSLRLERQLGVKKLVWFQSNKHDSSKQFEASIRDETINLVLLVIRWSRHEHIGAKAICERYDKPFIALPGGYGAEQIAHQVMQQTSQTLQKTQRSESYSSAVKDTSRQQPPHLSARNGSNKGHHE